MRFIVVIVVNDRLQNRILKSELSLSWVRVIDAMKLCWNRHQAANNRWQMVSVNNTSLTMWIYAVALLVVLAGEFLLLPAHHLYDCDNIGLSCISTDPCGVPQSKLCSWSSTAHHVR